MISRRQFLMMGAAAAAVVLVPSRWLPNIPTVKAFYQTPGVEKFKQPLRGVYPLDPNGIPVAVPDGKVKHGLVTADHYTLDINQFKDKLHPDMPPTTLWGYHPRAALGGTPPQRHLGGILIAQRGKPIQITVKNNLPKKHILPVDTSIMGAEGPQNRATVHLHGGEVPWISDGGPYSWFDPKGNYGPSVVSGTGLNTYKLLNPKLQPGEAEYYYPNRQSARMEWYHDHALGFTRLNAYAGMASAYIIRDEFEAALVKLGLPDFIEKGGNEIPLIFQDKIFVGEDILAKDENWTGLKAPGSLWYAHEYDTSRWVRGGDDPLPPLPSRQPLPDVSAIPEFFGDTMLVNGVVHPFAAVQPRRYRLRILNATQARFLNLQLYETRDDLTPDTSTHGPDFLVIGTEGGFLAFPAALPSNKPMNFVNGDPTTYTVDMANPGGSLLVAPGERFDVLVDFKGFEGKKFILYTDAPSPFPGGDEANDYPNDFNKVANTRTIMRFDVAPAISGSPDRPLRITTSTPLGLSPLSGMDPFPLPPMHNFVIRGKINPIPGYKIRELTLNEVFDASGRLIQMLGTNDVVDLPAGFSMDPGNPDAPNNYAREYEADATEVVKDGTTEVWQIANLTGDTHPIHFHLVNVLLLARQSFTDAAGNYLYKDGDPTYTGPARTANPEEWGWKETVKMNPGEVTTVVMKFQLPNVPFPVPHSPRTGGHEYVWHCHILEHEEHDMMRPLVVI